MKRKDAEYIIDALEYRLRLMQEHLSVDPGLLDDPLFLARYNGMQEMFELAKGLLESFVED